MGSRGGRPQPKARAGPPPSAVLRRSAVSRRRGHLCRRLDLRLTDAALDYLAARGYDPVFGARPLNRVIQREVANQLAEQILAGLVREGDAVEVDALPDGGGLTLSTLPDGHPEPAATSEEGEERPQRTASAPTSSTVGEA